MASDPEVKANAGIYHFSWQTEQVEITIDRLRETASRLTAEVDVSTTLPGVNGHLAHADISLASTAGKQGLVKILEQRLPGPEWYDLVEQACLTTIRLHRQGEPAVALGSLPDVPTTWLLEPLIQGGQANIIYGKGGCIAGETIINTPDGDFRVDYLAKQGRPIRVWALGTTGAIIARATCPFLKGRDALYRFTTTSGKQIMATRMHRFLTPDGWQYAGDLSIGDSLAVFSLGVQGTLASSVSFCPPPSSDGVYQLVQTLGASHSAQTPLNYKAHYSGDPHPCGERFQLAKDSDQLFAPSLNDAPEYNHLNCKKGDLFSLQEHIHPCQLSALPSRRYYVQGEPLEVVGQYDSEPSYYRRVSLNNPGLLPSPPSSSEAQPMSESAQSVTPNGARCPPPTHNYLYDTISAITLQGVAPYYDLHVPFYENYLANDIWNHNSGKSYLADLCALLVQYGLTHVGLTASTPKPILILDYETSPEIANNRIRELGDGLNIPSPALLYRYSTQPLAYDIQEIQRLVLKENIGLLIVDSVGLACGGEPERAETVIAYFRALRSLRIASLSVDHVTKGDNDKTATPFGSVYKLNLARNAWEVRSTSEENDDTLKLGLYHRKINQGKLRPALGISFTFAEGSIIIDDTEVKSDAELIRGLALRTRIDQALKEHGSLDDEELHQYLENDKAVIRSCLYRNKKMFVRLGKKWARLSLESSA